MPTKTSFSSFRLGHLFCGWQNLQNFLQEWTLTDYDIKNKNQNRKVEKLGKRESKCIQKDFLVPIYKIFLPKISTFDKQLENLTKAFNFADMNFHRWPISRNFVDDIFWKILWTYIFVGKGQKFAKPQKYLLAKISSFKVDCWNKTLLKPANIIGSGSLK